MTIIICETDTITAALFFVLLSNFPLELTKHPIEARSLN